MNLKFRILGCGTSGGVPRVGGDWGNCDPDNPKNDRLRCSLLVEQEGPEGQTRVLVDTSPDARRQLLDAEVSWLDGVLYTHDHADHTHGIDDLRAVALRMRARIDVFCDPRTGGILEEKFAYCFKAPPESAYQPILNMHMIEMHQPIEIPGKGGKVKVMPYPQHHGEIMSMGYRFGNLAYSCDINALPDESYKYLENLDVWIVDALRYSTHPSHFSLDETLEVIRQVKPKRAILTHMHTDLDYDTLVRELPEGVEPAFDGMVLEISG